MVVREEDIGRIGRAIYQDKILKSLDETADKGKLVVIDVNSGDYEAADGLQPDDDITTEERMRSRRPNAVTWAERVGYQAPYRMPSIRLLEIPEIAEL